MKFLLFQLVALFLVINCYADERPCPGCPVNQDVNDPAIMQGLKQVLSTQNEDGEVIKIIKAQSQVVSGMKYMVDFEYKDRRTQAVKLCHTSYMIQPWISNNYKIIEFTCKPVQQQTRQLLGGLKDVEENEMDFIKKLSIMAVKTLDDIDADDSKRTVVEIIDAKKQLVNGIMYYLTLRVRTTACKENEPDYNCPPEETLRHEICKIELHRSFAEQSPLNAKVVKSECDEQNVVSSSEINVESETVKEAAQFAAVRINQMSNSIYVQVLVRIVQATTEPDSEEKLNLVIELGNTDCMKNVHKGENCATVATNSEKMICRVSLLKSNDKPMKITTFNCGPFYRAKRALDGGESNLDTHSKKITDLIHFIENELTSRSNSQHTKTVVKVLNATTQVVSGTLTKVTVQVADTNCLKTDTNAENCSATDKGVQICQIAIWEQPWLNKKEITQSECHSIQNVGA